ncbi:MAG TPA: cobaltochelatase subunit CobN, partial [Pirellulales bacterium]
ARVLARLVALLFAIVLPAVPRVAGAQETPAPAAAAPAEAAPANDASNHGYRGPQPDREVVVLTTFLTSPAYVTKLKEAASRASLPLVVLEAEKASTDELKAALARATLLLIDLQHPNVAKTVAEKFGPVVAASETPYVAIGEAEALGQQTAAPLEPLRRLRALDPAWASRTAEYFRFGGKANTAALVALLSSREASPQAVLASVPAAVVLPAEGFFHPGWERLETDLRAVLSRVQQPNRPTVAIAVNRLALTSDDTAWLEALIAELEARGLACYAFFGARNNPQLFTQSTSLDAENGGLPAVDLVINAALVLRSNERRAELDKLGVPVLQTLPGLTISEQEWRASSEGLPLADVSFYLAASELAGMVDPVLISARNPTTGALDPLPAQIQAVAEKAAALCRLRRTPRAERRTVIVVYNYPQGENNFGASFLNVPKSLVNVLGAMKSGGYAVEVPTADAVIARTRDALTGFYDRDALARLVASGSAEFLPLDDYARWFASLPKETQDRIVAYWGEPQAGAVEVNGRLGFAIPAVRLGSVAVVPQPPRYELAYDAGAEVRKKRIGHRSSVPLSHAYLATYLWMREQWKADAVVHLGTHGTVEFAPGKERALATTDDPLLALGSLPNVYPYIMDNLGEATTAKRRGRAVMLSHLPPLATPAGFRPGLHEMHNLMHDWETATGPVKDALEKRLVEAFREHHLDRDLGWTSERIAAEFPAFMEVLHPFLDDVAQAAQPQGLAALGEVPSEERRFGMVLQILRKPLIEELGEDIDEVFLLDYEKVRDSRPGRWLRLALRDPQAASTLDLRRIDELDSSKHTSVPNRAAARPLDPAKLLALAQRAQALYATLGENQELVRLLDALDGKHVPAAYGGDPVRNPESLPTGRNIYGFDPARVPTQQA